MKKKLVSLLLAGSVVASMAAIASVSASAIIDSNGCYAPGDNVEATHRYYFAMPDSWYNEYATTAGIYWWSGTDACGAVDGTGGTLKWPGYKAQSSEEVKNLYFVDCPTDVSMFNWNNYVDGGEDSTADKYTKAIQTTNIASQFYSLDDSELYDQAWFDEMEEKYNNDKSELGDFAKNFFIDEEYGLGFSFNFDNMIYVTDPSKTIANEYNGKLNYVGDWYFYYGDGWYGTYPTKDEAEEKGTLKNISDAPATKDEGGNSGNNGNNGNAGNNGNNGNNKPGQPSTDPASSTKPASTDTPTSTVSGGAVQTGEATYAVILLVVLAAVSGVVVFTRKKYN